MKKYSFILMILIVGEVKSQVLHHQSMGSQGYFSNVEKFKVMQSIGQLSPIGNFKSKSIIIQQGFIQNLFEIEKNPIDLIDCKVYPNPTKDIITVSFDKSIKESYSLFLSDLTGKTISKWNNIDKQNIDISLKELSEGTYILAIEMNKSRFYKKIIKFNEK